MKTFIVKETIIKSKEDIWEFKANSKAELVEKLSDPYFKDGVKTKADDYQEIGRRLKIEEKI